MLIVYFITYDLNVFDYPILLHDGADVILLHCLGDLANKQLHDDIVVMEGGGGGR